ncbi:BnaA03g53710D [Brassica napus]|uniref:BnaA03g53710D protein n=1 Tax=Brassica napus TaxID=3708 RepID=A0A078I0V8_BRANA|nr:BnaA03g53710D [Brassica napus]
MIGYMFHEMDDYINKIHDSGDFELAKMLVRVTPAMTSNLTGTKSLTEEGYGSVTRVYIVCGEDKGISEEYQRWMIENFPVKEVMEIEGADHMPMFSKPQELCDRLLKIADKYA